MQVRATTRNVIACFGATFLSIALSGCSSTTEARDDRPLRDAIAVSVRRTAADSIVAVVRNSSDRAITIQCFLLMDAATWQREARPCHLLPVRDNLRAQDSLTVVIPAPRQQAPSPRLVVFDAYYFATGPRITLTHPVPD